MAQTSTTLSVRIDVRTKKQLEALAGRAPQERRDLAPLVGRETRAQGAFGVTVVSHYRASVVGLLTGLPFQKPLNVANRSAASSMCPAPA